MAILAKSMIYILAMALIFHALILQHESRISATDPITQNFRFSFSSFPPTSTANISVFGDAQPTSRGYLQLTSDGQNINLTASVGRALYTKPITLWSPSTNYTASFNTSFTFAIRNVSSTGFGNGMAFVMASALAASPSGSQGGMLGLSNIHIDGNQSNHFVAIEFDTYQNINRKFKFHDIDGNHIGLDINGVVSKMAVQLNNTGINLKSGNNISAWIDYDGHAKQLDVYLSENKVKPISAPLLSDNIDLSKFILQEMYVGFTGSTGQTVELHDVYSWEFSSTRLQSDSTGSSPASKSVSVTPSSIPKAGNRSTPVAARMLKAKLIIFVVLGVSLVMCGAISALLLAYYCLYKKHRIMPSTATRKSLKETSADPSAFILTADFLYGPRKFTYKELSAATNQFSEKQVLGRGGFGSVYKGILPNNATMIAVKRTSKTSSQGEREFIAEVSIIGRLRHRNLVPLLGWCHRKGDLLLVYEFMPNGSLDQLLFASKGMDQFLDWTRRYKIVCGLAAALLYLHDEWEDQVVHRDVKASNVMLDANFTARLGDFGLARLIQHNKHAETTMAAGTLGYLAPEVSQTGKATTKSDVYSFGAVALEVACGRRPIDRTLPHDESILLDWVWELHAEDKIMDAADPRLELPHDHESSMSSMNNVCSEVKCMLQVGLACSHPDPDARPSIRQVLQILNGDAPMPSIPTTKPVPNYFPFSFNQIFADMAALNAHAPMQQQQQQQQAAQAAAHAAPAKRISMELVVKKDSMSFTELETSAIATSAGIALLR